uniref:SnoaL-like domain-containing protein n=1 Tax=uncultured Armatimonadetes bacterium TaxID=157466 RepID=A0A6J4I4Q8_9BACT|nr:hypothetical protein AVDCRST_MAG63-2510 [uncultured Armatimonadetes bacterium]
MAEDTAHRFVRALEALEAHHDLNDIVALFDERSDIGNVLHPESFHGPDGARRFWTTYRESFAEVRSTFRNRIVSADRAALEWNTRGTSTSGSPFSYDGVSVLEIEGDKITRFRAYFNPHALGRQMEPNSRS